MTSAATTKITGARIAPGVTITFGTDGPDAQGQLWPLLASGWRKANMVTVTVAEVAEVESHGKGLRSLLIKGTNGEVVRIQTSQKVGVVG